MMGDAVDNIPGLPGVGEKTAKKFLAEYGTIENLLANTHELKGAIKEKIEANKEKGLLSKKLATILLDCPVTFDATDYELSKPDVEKTDALFQELEFRQMKAQFDKWFGTGKEYDEINTNGNGNGNDNNNDKNQSIKNLLQKNPTKINLIYSVLVMNSDEPTQIRFMPR
jgi:DNA polymerase I